MSATALRQIGGFGRTGGQVFTSSAAPTADNDVNHGIFPGDIVVDTTHSKAYINLTNTASGATWQDTSAGGGGSGPTLGGTNGKFVTKTSDSELGTLSDLGPNQLISAFNFMPTRPAFGFVGGDRAPFSGFAFDPFDGYGNMLDGWVDNIITVSDGNYELHFTFNHTTDGDGNWLWQLSISLAGFSGDHDTDVFTFAACPPFTFPTGQQITADNPSGGPASGATLSIVPDSGATGSIYTPLPTNPYTWNSLTWNLSGNWSFGIGHNALFIFNNGGIQFGQQGWYGFWSNGGDGHMAVGVDHVEWWLVTDPDDPNTFYANGGKLQVVDDHRINYNGMLESRRFNSPSNGFATDGSPIPLSLSQNFTVTVDSDFSIGPPDVTPFDEETFSIRIYNQGGGDANPTFDSIYRLPTGASVAAIPSGATHRYMAKYNADAGKCDLSGGPLEYT